jgi:hypothetical protein
MAKEQVSQAQVDAAMAVHAQYYPDYTRESLEKAIRGILEAGHQMSSITLDYWMKPVAFGGKGYGKPSGKPYKTPSQHVGGALTCGWCGVVVKTTHPMQTIEAQMVHHLRTEHKQTANEAKKLTNLWLKAENERQHRGAHPFLPTVEAVSSPCGKSCRGHKVKPRLTK